MRQLLSIAFPQRFRISQNFWHPTSGSGGKKTHKIFSKNPKKSKYHKNKTSQNVNNKKITISRNHFFFKNFWNVLIIEENSLRPELSEHYRQNRNGEGQKSLCLIWNLTKKWNMTYDIWHVTHDSGHVTCDTPRMVIIVLKFHVPSSHGLGVMMF